MPAETGSSEQGDFAQQPSMESPRRGGTPSVTEGPLTSLPAPPPKPPKQPLPLEDCSRPRTSRLDPPVTKATLSELDVGKIIHNPKLRHDINFDPDLHFRPNLDGEKGRRKQEKANQFWATLRDQLIQFVVDRDSFHRRLQEEGIGQDWTLPCLLKAVKEIIQTLVPLRDREILDEGLNVDLLMQQFNQNIADLEKLAAWLSQVLRSHCAPMRDEWVDEMYNQLSRGNRNNDMDELVRGMRTLLSVLEAMKLDVANHQIRCLRPVLIEDTVHFEQRFFLKKMQAGKFDPYEARLWYRAARTAYEDDAAYAHDFGEMAIFFKALSRLVLLSTVAQDVPNSFLFDEERILKLRVDMVDAINLKICMSLWEALERKYRSAPPASALLLMQRSAVGRGLGSSMRDDDSVHSADSDHDFHNERPSSAVFSTADSDSPRSSVYLSENGAAPQFQFQHHQRPPPSRADSRTVYNALVAILQSVPPPTVQSSARPCERWTAITGNMAVEIFRHTNAPQYELAVLEKQLEHLVQYEMALTYWGPYSVSTGSTTNMGDESTSAAATAAQQQQQQSSYFLPPRFPLYDAVESHLHSLLLAELARRVREFRGLTGVGLFSAATGGRIHGPGRTWDGGRTTEGSAAQQAAGGHHHHHNHLSAGRSNASSIRSASSSRVPSANSSTTDLVMGLESAAASATPAAAIRDESTPMIEDMATRLAHLGVLHWRVWARLAYLHEHEDEVTEDEAPTLAVGAGARAAAATSGQSGSGSGSVTAATTTTTTAVPADVVMRDHDDHPDDADANGPGGGGDAAV